MTPRSGFTLLEISVVLLIIGLLIGSITLAKSLARASQLQAAITEYDMYLKAIQEFRDRYVALPGDMSIATSLWGIQTTNCSPPSSDYTTAEIATNTCDGDGNGKVGWVSNLSLDTCSFTNPLAWCPYEAYLAWQHLANAGLVDGRYNGRTNTTGDIENGVNAPASRLKGAGWAIQFILPPAATGTTSDLWDDQYGHVLILGGAGARSHVDGGYGVLTPKEALELDSKMDDGRPGTGTFRHWRPSARYDYADCVGNDTSQTAMTYSTTGATADTLACSPLFVPGF